MSLLNGENVTSDGGKGLHGILSLLGSGIGNSGYLGSQLAKVNSGLGDYASGGNFGLDLLKRVFMNTFQVIVGPLPNDTGAYGLGSEKETNNAGNRFTPVEGSELQTNSTQKSTIKYVTVP